MKEIEVSDAIIQGYDPRKKCPDCSSQNIKMVNATGPYRDNQFRKVLSNTMKCFDCRTTWRYTEALD